MSEEQEKGGFFSNLKNQVMTGAGVILTGLGTMFMDEVKSFIGIEDEPTEQVQGVQQNNTQQQSNNQQVIINIPEQKPVVETKTVIIRDTTSRKPIKKKEKEEEIDW